MPVDPRRVQSIFLAALGSQDAVRRGEVVDLECANDIELRRRVEALLAAHDHPDSLLDHPLVTPADPDGGVDTLFPVGITSDAESVAKTVTRPPNTVVDDRSSLTKGEPGVEIGPYKLLRKLGTGGMGTVYLAEQERPIRRRVALKLINDGMHSRSIMARFEQERQALAVLDHPNIAKIFDAGLAVDGKPFFVMELVDGLPLTKFCDSNKLTLPERIHLFVYVCQAVQHAHMKGIIHRDLKPANILVAMIDGKPVPKVIDFGVAKATEAKLTDLSLITQFGSMVGTLEYMSPEQAGLSGEDIDTRSDIYALGVILYEMLVGFKPIDAQRLGDVALLEMLRVIREEEPSKPSTRLSDEASLPSVAATRQTDPRRLMALLHGELDWVVMKCLEKQRDRRYETANALARDLERYLADEAVEARPPTKGYRLRKFLSRNRTQAITVSLMVLTILGGLAGAVGVQARANRVLEAKNTELTAEQAKVEARNKELATEKSKVQARFDLARKAIATFHTGVSQDALLKQEQLRDLRSNLLKQAAGFYTDLEVLLHDQPDPSSRLALADAYDKLGGLTQEISPLPEALIVQQKGLDLMRSLADSSESNDVVLLRLINSLRQVGSLQSQTGDNGAALKSLEEARTRAETLLKSSGSTDAASSLGNINYILANTYFRTGRLPEAEDAYRKTIDTLEPLARKFPNIKDYQGKFANANMNLGNTLFHRGLTKEALTFYQKARNIHKKALDDAPTDRQVRQALAIDDASIANVLAGQERLESMRKAMTGFQKLVEDYPAVTDYQSTLATLQNNMAKYLSDNGEFAEAVSLHEESLATRQRLADANPQIPQYQQELSASLNNLGRLHAREGRFDLAFPLLDRGLLIREKLRSAFPGAQWAETLVGYSHSYRGWARYKEGRHAPAAVDLRNAVQFLSNDPSRDVRLEMAKSLALLATLGKEPASAVTPTESSEFADKAVAKLQEAQNAGLDQSSPLEESEFDVLRHREDFQKIATSLQVKSSSKPETQQ